MSHAEPAARGEDVLLALAYHTWADGLARQLSWSPDQIALHLMRDTSIGSVVVSNPLRSQVARVKRSGRDIDAGLPQVPRRRLVQPRRWRRQDAPSIPTTVRAYRHLDSWLAGQGRRAGQDRPVLVTCHPVLAAVADPERWSDVVYYGWDDWLTYPKHAHLRDLIAHSYAEMAARDVNVIGVTRAIVDRIGSPRRTVVPNGLTSADHEVDVEPPAWFSALTGPVALYVGALQERVDVDALHRCALELPDWTFVLVGPMQDPARFERLREVPNVRVLPPEPRPVALAMMARATVCLVPHRRTPMSEAMSPLKLYEYLAEGASVVATDLEPMRDVSPHCLLVEQGAPLAPAVLAAAAGPRATEVEVDAFRAHHDWRNRYLAWRSAALGR